MSRLDPGSSLFASLMYGEVVSAIPSRDTGDPDSVRWKYAVKCTLPGGRTHVFQHAVLMEWTSGVNNFFQRVIRTSGGFTTKAYDYRVYKEDGKLTIGDRCLVGFINSRFEMPVILGFLPHPGSSSTLEYILERDVAEDLDPPQDSPVPRMHGLFNGLDFKINETGELIITHSGVEKVDQPSGPFTKYERTPPSLEHLSCFKMGDHGIVEIATNYGHLISCNPKLKTLTVGSPKGHLILDDNALFCNLYSSGSISLLATKEMVVRSGGALDFLIKGVADFKFRSDFKTLVQGKTDFTAEKPVNLLLKDSLTITSKDITATLDGALTMNVSKDTMLALKGKFTIDTPTKEIRLQGGTGATLSLNSGKVALGTSAVELLDQILQVFTEMITAAPKFVATSVGPGVLDPGVLAKLTSVKAALTTIKGSI